MFGGLEKNTYICRQEKRMLMETITFSPAQIHILNLVSHIKSPTGLELLKEQLSEFYAKQIDYDMEELWNAGEWDEQKLHDLRHAHFRTPYNK